jgi:hypothetical protein
LQQYRWNSKYGQICAGIQRLGRVLLPASTLSLVNCSAKTAVQSSEGKRGGVAKVENTCGDVLTWKSMGWNLVA